VFRTEAEGVGKIEAQKIFVTKRMEGTEKWIECHSAELEHWYFTAITLQMITSRRMRWAGHVAQTDGKKCRLVFGGNS